MALMQQDVTSLVVDYMEVLTNFACGLQELNTDEVISSSVKQREAFNYVMHAFRAVNEELRSGRIDPKRGDQHLLRFIEGVIIRLYTLEEFDAGTLLGTSHAEYCLERDIELAMRLLAPASAGVSR